MLVQSLIKFNRFTQGVYSLEQISIIQSDDRADASYNQGPQKLVIHT